MRKQDRIIRNRFVQTVGVTFAIIAGWFFGDSTGRSFSLDAFLVAMIILSVVFVLVILGLVCSVWLRDKYPALFR